MVVVGVVVGVGRPHVAHVVVPAVPPPAHPGRMACPPPSTRAPGFGLPQCGWVLAMPSRVGRWTVATGDEGDGGCGGGKWDGRWEEDGCQ